MEGNLSIKKLQKHFKKDNKVNKVKIKKIKLIMEVFVLNVCHYEVKNNLFSPKSK